MVGSEVLGVGTRNGRVLERISRTLAAGERPDSWQDNRISYFENMRAEMSILNKTGGGYWHTIGCTPAEAKLVEPLVLHFYSLVYQGDIIYEAAQQAGSSRVTDHSWKTRMQELLKNHNLYDSRIQAGVDNLERYYVMEGQLLLGELPLTEEVIEEISFLRSSDLHVMIRVMDRLKGRTPNEQFYQLLKAPMALFDIGDDFDSYERDIADASYNSLRLYVALYGVEQAREKLQALRERIWARGLALFGEVGKPALVRYLTSTPLVNLNLPVVPELLGTLPRAVLAKLAVSAYKLEGNGAEVIPEPIAESGPLVPVS